MSTRNTQRSVYRGGDTDQKTHVLYLDWQHQPDVVIDHLTGEPTPTADEINDQYKHVGHQYETDLDTVFDVWNKQYWVNPDLDVASFLSTVRSMSVGDIVLQGTEVYICRNEGWDELDIDPDDLTILD